MEVIYLLSGVFALIDDEAVAVLIQSFRAGYLGGHTNHPPETGSSLSSTVVRGVMCFRGITSTW